ncbi:hypothetical protein ACFU8R_28630 [Pseudonocardia alni]|jgi:hypothetical protein|uniref:hypothetical protein n=1 Tax=Pseudonocardia alni TaxID=33907 RepID=UPI0036CD28AF
MTVSQWDAAAISLYRRFCAGDVTPAEMAVELPPIWRFRSDRDPLHGPVAWQAMVEHAGYFCWGPEGGRPGRRPRRRHRLFRGAVPQRRQGMSWTTNPAIARWFAEHRQVPAEVGLGRVWVAVLEPSRVLGYLHDEREFLVDATDLAVQPWTGPDSGPVVRTRRWIADYVYW